MKTYESPELQIIVFETDDIITTSGTAQRKLTDADVMGINVSWKQEWFN